MSPAWIHVRKVVPVVGLVNHPILADHVEGGLAVHAGLPPDKGWVITHLASGDRMGRCFQSATAALEALRKLLPLANWQQHKNRIPLQDKAFRDKVREAFGGVLHRGEDPAIEDDGDHL